MKKIKIRFEIPEEVKDISRVISVAGFENFLVGGCVRDLIIGRGPKDWDFTTNAKPDEIIKLFPKTFYENEYGTVGVVNEQTDDKTLKVVEVTPYRLESGYSDFRRPDKVEWGKTIEDDLARRDFTMNALAYSIKTEELLDLFQGKEDIEKKIIRTVGKPEERFGEDALRMFRALRLASELNFAIEHETQMAIMKHAELLTHISRERIRDEFEKIIMSDTPAFAIELASRLGLLKFISSEFEKGIGMEQNQAHAYTVWEHLLRTLNHAAKKNFPLYVRLAAFAHDVAKPHTRKRINGQWTFYNHEVLGARLARNILTDLRFPKEIVEKVVKLVRWHMFFSDTEKITLSAVRRIVRNVGTDLIWDLVDLRVCDRIGTGRPKETPFRLRKYKSMIEEAMRDPISVKQLALGGADIMRLTDIGPGPHIGFILEILLSKVLEKPGLNTREYLEDRVRELHALKPDELAKLGKTARSKNENEEEKEIEKIREEYKVQ
ncbi:MAG: HD domain-containing protein [bacterium]|nr:HD domain-containing protein [bacterium]